MKEGKSFEIAPQPSDKDKIASGKMAGKRGESYAETFEGPSEEQDANPEKTEHDIEVGKVKEGLSEMASSANQITHRVEELIGLIEAQEKHPLVGVNPAAAEEFKKGGKYSLMIEELKKAVEDIITGGKLWVDKPRSPKKK